jgi:hypothetical protein
VEPPRRTRIVTAFGVHGDALTAVGLAESVGVSEGEADVLSLGVASLGVVSVAVVSVGVPSLVTTAGVVTLSLVVGAAGGLVVAAGESFDPVLHAASSTTAVAANVHEPTRDKDFAITCRFSDLSSTAGCRP